MVSLYTSRSLTGRAFLTSLFYHSSFVHRRIPHHTHTIYLLSTLVTSLAIYTSQFGYTHSFLSFFLWTYYEYTFPTGHTHTHFFSYRATGTFGCSDRWENAQMLGKCDNTITLLPNSRETLREVWVLGSLGVGTWKTRRLPCVLQKTRVTEQDRLTARQ